MEWDLKTKYDGPNIYWHDFDNYKYPKIQFIAWAMTPTGRRSKFYYQIRVKAKHGETRKQLIAKAKREYTILPKLKPGYKWGPMQIQFDFSTPRKSCTQVKVAGKIFALCTSRRNLEIFHHEAKNKN